MQKPLKTTLSNGLRVILLESHTAPVVSWNLWSNVGSVNETDQEAGLCHLIEHMIFKGTSRRPVGQIAKEVEASGGDINAYTSFDETVFYINMSSRQMDVGLDILADAALDPTFDAGELAKEKEVVVEEISRAEDNPSQMVSQDLFSNSFIVHPYRRPIAGDRETVRGVSREHLLAFYHRWYVGSNLIFIGVGDFKIPEILPRIETLFSKIPSGLPPAQQIPAEPDQREQRIVTREMLVEGRYFDLGLPIPNLMHPDIPTLDLLSQILGNGPSSRLEHSLKEKKHLVSAIASYPYTPRHPGLFVIGGVLREKALKESLVGIWQEVEQLKQEAPPTVEFYRARENMRSARIYERQTVEAMARKFGFFEGIAGSLDFEDEYYRRLSEVTPDDIRKVAQTYLKSERIVLSLCHPKGESWPQGRLSEWLKTATAPSKKVAPKLAKDQVVRFKLSNGIRVLIRQNSNLPLVSIKSASLGGIRFENSKNNGINHLISLVQTKGTTLRTAREIAELSENLSGHVDSYMGRNLIGLSGSFVSEKIVEALDLYFDILQNPSFPEDEIRKEKDHTLTALRNEEDHLASVAMKKFLAALYPHHPYGFPTLGTASSVKKLTRKQLIDYYKGIVRPDNLVFSIVGDVSPDDIKVRLEERLGSWKAPQRRLAMPRLPQAPKKPIEVTTIKKKLQAHIVYGFLGTTLKSPDRYPLEVLNSVLSGQGGRLFLELRDKNSLCYAISASAHEGIEPGYVTTYMGTDMSKVDTALAGIKNELKKITEELVSEEEIERAKRFIIGNYELDLQKNGTVSALLAYNEAYGIGHEELIRYPAKIESVTRQDVLRIAKKYLKPQSSVLSVVKD